MSVAYGSSPSAGGEVVRPHARLRIAVRKAFMESETPLLEWEEANRHSQSVLEALSNAATRRADFAASSGILGVLSRAPFEDAERLLGVRLVTSMERLLAALHPVAGDFQDACAKLNDVYEGLAKDQLDLQVSDIEPENGISLSVFAV